MMRQLYNDEGILYTVEGAYNLCDNGYHKWSTIILVLQEKQISE